MERTNDDPYMRDAVFLLGIAESARERGEDRALLVEAVLFLALGIDRMIKARLSLVNPLYVYEKQDFSHTMVAHYSEQVLSDAPTKVLAKEPDKGLCSLGSGAHRAAVAGQSHQIFCEFAPSTRSM